MEKIPVLQVVPHSCRGGVESVAAELMRVDKRKYISHYVYFLDDNEIHLRKSYVKGFFSLFRYAIKNNVKLIHNHSPLLKWLFFTRLVSILLRVPLVITIHSDFGLNDEISLFKRGKSFAIVRFLNRLHRHLVADFWIAVSEPVSLFLVDKVNVDSKMICVINNFIHKTEIDVSNQIEKRKYVVYVGRDSKEKNVSDLVMAWKQINGRFEDVSLLLIGVSRDSECLLGVDLEESRIIATGWLAEMEINQLMTNALLQVIPSSYEGFPLAFLQAVEKNIPVVTYNIPIFSHLSSVIDGLFVANGNDYVSLSEMMSVVILKVKDGYVLKEKTKVNNMFSSKKFLSEHENTYHFIIKSPN